MGLPMAGHLLAAGHALVVHSRTKSRADELLAKGAVWANSPADAAKDADAVFICVTDTPDVQKVVLGNHNSKNDTEKTGIIHVMKPGQIIVDHSTISPSATRTMAKSIAEKGGHFIDAPISGGDIGAKNATLAIMVGGDQNAYEQILPLLQHLGKTITYCGVSGNGQLTKLANQILVSVTNLAVSEALNFALKNGLDGLTTINAVAGGGAGSWQLQNLGPRMIKGDFAPAFMVDLQQKDLRLVLQSAVESQTSLPATSLVNQLFTAAQAAGDGRQGTQVLFKVLGKMSGRD